MQDELNKEGDPETPGQTSSVVGDPETPGEANQEQDVVGFAETGDPETPGNPPPRQPGDPETPGS